MRIGLDVCPLAKKMVSGKGVYVRQLVHGLSDLIGPENLVLFRRFGRPKPRGVPSGVKHARYTGQRSFRALDRGKQAGLSVFHYTNSNVVYPPSVPAVLTLHDIHDLVTNRAERGPKYKKKVEARYRGIRAARPWLITDSEYSLKDILARFPEFEGRSRVVYLGVDPVYKVRAPEEVAKFRSQQGLNRPYVLFTGSVSERKNFTRVLESFLEVNQRLEGRCRLVVAGKGSEGIQERGLDRASWIQPLGYVPDDQMPLLYGGAECLLWPSLFEGFGYPIVEAMACGCPVITSRTTSCGEVAGDAALKVDPLEIRELIDALEALLTRKDLRERHAGAGLKRAKVFSWERVAEQTLDVYREAVKSGSG